MAVPPVLIHLVFGVSIPNHAITGVPPFMDTPLYVLYVLRRVVAFRFWKQQHQQPLNKMLSLSLELSREKKTA